MRLVAFRIPSQESSISQYRTESLHKKSVSRTLEDCPNYRIAAKRAERITDHSLRIAHAFFFLVDATKDPHSFPGRAQRLSKTTCDMYEASLRSLF